MSYAHRIDSRYLDACSNNCRKSIIIHFTTFRLRTIFYRAKNKLKRGVRTELDLTKSRYDLLKRANDHVEEVHPIKLCYADINCRLEVKFNDKNQKDNFFPSFDDLRDILDMEIQPCLSICQFLFFVVVVVVVVVVTVVLFCFLSLGL